MNVSRTNTIFWSSAGVEVSTDLGEILVFGLHQSVLQVYDAVELRTMVDEVDGVMVMAHPFRSEPELFSGFDLPDPEGDGR